MAIFYVAHKFGGDPENVKRAAQITHDLQLADPGNCYITPLLAFGHIGYNEIGYDAEMRLCLELLSRCDKMIVASEHISKGVQIEINYCKKWGIPVIYLA
jgi:hypothetical protein